MSKDAPAALVLTYPLCPGLQQWAIPRSGSKQGGQNSESCVMRRGIPIVTACAPLGATMPAAAALPAGMVEGVGYTRGAVPRHLSVQGMVDMPTRSP